MLVLTRTNLVRVYGNGQSWSLLAKRRGGTEIDNEGSESPRCADSAVPCLQGRRWHERTKEV